MWRGCVAPLNNIKSIKSIKQHARRRFSGKMRYSNFCCLTIKKNRYIAGKSFGMSVIFRETRTMDAAVCLAVRVSVLTMPAWDGLPKWAEGSCVSITCPKPVRNLSETWLKHGWNMAETWLKHGWSIPEAYLKHIWSLFETYFRRV